MSSPSQEAVAREAAHKFCFRHTIGEVQDELEQVIRSAIDKSRAAEPQTNFARVQELAREICEIREALGIKIGTREKVLEHIKNLRAARQEWRDRLEELSSACYNERQHNGDIGMNAENDCYCLRCCSVRFVAANNASLKPMSEPLTT